MEQQSSWVVRDRELFLLSQKVGNREVTVEAFDGFNQICVYCLPDKTLEDKQDIPGYGLDGGIRAMKMANKIVEQLKRKKSH